MSTIGGGEPRHRLRTALIAAPTLIAALCLLARPVAAAPQPRPPVSVTCEACVVVADGGRVLWARGAAAEHPNASTTKMMTALVVVDAGRRAGAGWLDDTVAVSANAAATGGGGLDLVEGRPWSVRSLLYALLLSSSNDAAVALAEHSAPTVGAFVEAMNHKARRLGLGHTHFVTPHGLDVPGHHSSARDLATLGEELLGIHALADIVATPEASVPGWSGRRRGLVRLENSNLLLEGYRGADGIKTGFTAGAGEVLVASAVHQGRRVISVAMRSDDAAADSRKLLDFGFARLSHTALLREGIEIGAFVFDPAGSISVAAGKTLRGLQRRAGLETSVIAADVALPIEPGEVVGTVLLHSGPRIVGRADAVALGSLEAPEQSWLTRSLASVLEWGHRFAEMVT